MVVKKAKAPDGGEFDDLDPTTKKKLAEARAKQAIAEAVKAEAEADKASAEAEGARLDNALVTIEVAQVQRKEREALADNKYHHVYMFDQPVMGGSVSSCIAQLKIWERTDPKCAVEIQFNSPGGFVIDGMYLFDYIQKLRREGHKVTTVTFGMAASMAGILLQAGDERQMGAEAYILIHEIAAGAVGKVGEMEDEMAFIHMIGERILDIFAARSKMKRSEIARRWRRRDWWISSKEALKWGFVDKVL
jgi:ATP-dependent Clp endopeptidase proteolytic subunit ClpP